MHVIPAFSNTHAHADHAAATAQAASAIAETITGSRDENPRSHAGVDRVPRSFTRPDTRIQMRSVLSLDTSAARGHPVKPRTSFRTHAPEVTDTEISSTADPSPSYLSSTAWVYSSAASIRAASVGIAVKSMTPASMTPSPRSKGLRARASVSTPAPVTER